MLMYKPSKYDYQPSALVIAAYRHNNKFIRFIGHYVFGRRCGFPACCVLQFSWERVYREGKLQAIVRECHPASDKYTGCKADFVHCSYHAWRGHDCLTKRTKHNSK